jgi:hypothetical protein
MLWLMVGDLEQAALLPFRETAPSSPPGVLHEVPCHLHRLDQQSVRSFDTWYCEHDLTLNIWVCAMFKKQSNKARSSPKGGCLNCRSMFASLNCPFCVSHTVAHFEAHHIHSGLLFSPDTTSQFPCFPIDRPLVAVYQRCQLRTTFK